MTNILVVEDNKISRDNLCRVIKDNIEDVQIFEAAIGRKAIKIFKEHRIDIFFLDIMLPDISGLKIAECIRSMEYYEMAYIIFITTHLVHLSKALQEYHCYDFIEKPFSKKKIIEIINRLIRGMTPRKIVQEEPYITLQNKNIYNKVLLNDIYFIEVLGRRLKVHTKTGVIELSNKTLKNIIDQIEPICKDCFIKSHRSYYINIRHVTHVNRLRKRSWEVIFKDYEGTAFVSESYKDIVFDRLG